jgi:hypothetical protein
MTDNNAHLLLKKALGGSRRWAYMPAEVEAVDSENT